MVKVIVNFAKEIPGFSSLASSDKIVLLKGAVTEVCYNIHCVQRFFERYVVAIAFCD